MKILVTGSAGFINGYLIQELLDAGHTVVGLDNFSKYGRLEKSYDTHPNYKLVEGNAKDRALLDELLEGCDHFVASAAMIGGISYFHEFAYDLLAENERITATAFDAAIRAHKHGKLQKITVVSSSMVFENTTEFPDARRRAAPLPAAQFDLRLPEAGDRILHAGCMGAVSAAVHRLRVRSTASASARSARWPTATS